MAPRQQEVKLTAVEQMKVMVDPVGRVSRKEAAKALSKKPKTLAEWKSKGLGPKSFLVGGRVYYWWSDVQAFARGEVK